MSKITQAGSPVLFTSSESTSNTWLAAALCALGIRPDMQRPLTRVIGETIQTERITWYFATRSDCGRYDTGTMLKAWDDREFHERNPEHPLAYLKVGFENHHRLVDLIKQRVPLVLVRKSYGDRYRYGFIREDAPGRIVQKMERFL